MGAFSVGVRAPMTRVFVREVVPAPRIQHLPRMTPGVSNPVNFRMLLERPIMP